MKHKMPSLRWAGFPLLALIFHAYSLGSGTYTGLEAVSNNVNRLREPRVATGKWTMFYMAVSLSLTAARYDFTYFYFGSHNPRWTNIKCRCLSFHFR